MAGTAQLERQGVTGTSFPPGTVITRAGRSDTQVTSRQRRLDRAEVERWLPAPAALVAPEEKYVTMASTMASK